MTYLQCRQKLGDDHLFVSVFLVSMLVASRAQLQQQQLRTNGTLRVASLDQGILKLGWFISGSKFFFFIKI